jgi:hypothetical protein
VRGLKAGTFQVWVRESQRRAPPPPEDGNTRGDLQHRRALAASHLDQAVAAAAGYGQCKPIDDSRYGDVKSLGFRF